MFAELRALGPVLTPLCGLLGVLGGAWLVYRQGGRQTDATARTSSDANHVTAMKTVTDAFTQVVAEQRTHQEKTAERVTLLESKVSALEEEQRKHHRWKDAALRYIGVLRQKIAEFGGAPPVPEEIIRADVGD